MFVGLGRFGRRSNGWSVGVGGMRRLVGGGEQMLLSLGLGEVACMAVTACSSDGLFSFGTGIREAEHLRGCSLRG
ncbi:hypothetical protein, conserved [Eimeria praecox]|uniref:Uncharacterized protein n=1 Tax=Eimeria praecox TaxID=51316 RepID=U6H2T4_9EIME|nr:hypothetical protein, conserved [Eimeria praecox]